MSKNVTLLEAVEQLDEGLLNSDYTMGFELECYVKYDSPIYNRITNEGYYTYDDEDSEDENRYVYDNVTDYFTYLLKTIDNVQIPDETSGQPESHEDSSVNNRNYYKDVSVEYSSPIIPCKPIWFNKIIKTLEYLTSNGVYVNDTCGFHHHLHFKGMTERDMVWLYCNIAADPEFYREFHALGDWDLSDDTYASYDALFDLGRALVNKNFDETLSLLNTNKWRVFRIHPQGTLEWRGPRGFLEEGTRHIKTFYKLMIKLISKISTYMDSKVVIGTTITKDELFNGLIDAVPRAEEPPTLEFLKHSESYDSSKKLNYISKWGNVTEKSMKKFADAIAKQPLILYTLIMQEHEKVGKFIDAMMSSYQGEYSFKKALKGIVEKGKASNEFVAHYFNVTNTMDMELYLKVLIECGYHEYLTHQTILQFLSGSDSTSDLFGRVETVIENQVPLSIKDIEYALYRLACANSFVYEYFVEWFIGRNNRLKLADKVIVKMLMFITQCVLIKDIQYRLPSNTDMNTIKKLVINADMVNEWNTMIVNYIKYDAELYNMYIGDKTVKDIFNLIKRNSTVTQYLSGDDITKLEDNGIYI